MVTNTKTAVRHLTAGDVTAATGDQIVAVQSAYFPGTRRMRGTHRMVCLKNNNGEQRWVQWNASTEIYITR